MATWLKRQKESWGEKKCVLEKANEKWKAIFVREGDKQNRWQKGLNDWRGKKVWKRSWKRIKI